MRRLWAHIIIAFTALFMMGASFSAIFTQVSSNNEYHQGREIIFKLTDKEDEELPVKEGASKEIANTMASRLDTAGVTAYQIAVSGDDMIKVEFSESNETQMNNIVNYLSFNGIFGLSNKDDNDNYYHITEDEFLKEGSQAYLDSVNSYPTVVIPVNTESSEFKLLLENTKTQKENGIGETRETGETDADGNPVTETITYLYLWYDFNEETDRFSRTQPDSEDYDEKIANKIIMTFNIEDPYYPDNHEDKLSATINIDTNGDQTASVTEVRDAYDKARYYVNLLNASPLDYDVTYVNDSHPIYTNPWTELIVTNGDPHQSLNWSRTLIATICAIVILALLLVAFYRLGALSVGTCTIASVFTALALLVTIGTEFNIGALIGTIIVAVASLISGIIYLSKLKDESYKGRSLKKANSEAAKKALLPTLDINITVMVVGALLYAFGGSLMVSFALACVLGGLFSFLFNALGLRGLMWLATNTTGLTGKYNVFGIDNSKVPSIINEEKQTYYGSFADKDFTKKKKPVFITMCAIFAICLAGMITSACLYKGQLFTVKNVPQVSEIYITTTTKDSFITKNDFIENEVLKNIYVINGNETKPLNDYVSGTETFTYSEDKEGITVDTAYYIATFDTLFANDISAYYKNPTETPKTLTDVLQTVIEEADVKASAEVKTLSINNATTPNAGFIILGCSVSILVLGVYFMLRYRLSRGITSIIIPVLTTGVAAGFFSILSLAQASITPYVIVALPLVTTFSIILSIIFMNKERELVLDDRSKDNSVENRELIMKKAISIAFTPIVVATILVSYLMINFFGFGPTSTSLPFVLALVGTLLAALLVTTLYGPISQFFFAQFKKVNLEIKPRKKKGKKVVNKSGEPEEATFIGIND